MCSTGTVDGPSVMTCSLCGQNMHCKGFFGVVVVLLLSVHPYAIKHTHK